MMTDGDDLTRWEGTANVYAAIVGGADDRPFTAGRLPSCDTRSETSPAGASQTDSGHGWLIAHLPGASAWSSASTQPGPERLHGSAPPRPVPALRPARATPAPCPSPPCRTLLLRPDPVRGPVAGKWHRHVREYHHHGQRENLLRRPRPLPPTTPKIAT